MKLRIRKLDIITQGHNVCLLNSEDARKLHIKNTDRVFLKKGSKSSYAVVDIANTHHFLKNGEIGLFSEVCEELSLKAGGSISVDLADKPVTLNLIKKKLEGKALGDSEIYSIVSDIVSSKLSEVEIAHFISGCYSVGLSLDEISSIANALVTTGNILKFDKYPLVDLRILGSLSHSLNFIVASIISCLKIGFLGLLDDDVSSPSNFSFVFDSFGMKPAVVSNANSMLNRFSCLFISRNEAYITPGVNKIKQIEHPISAYSDGLIAASILSEGKSVSSSHSFICILYGVGRPIPDLASAKRLKNALLKASKKLRVKLAISIMDGNFPLEKNIGHLESNDVIMALKNEATHSKLIDAAIEVSGEILNLVGKRNGKKIAAEIIKSGQALDQFRKVVKQYNGKTILNNFVEGIISKDIRASKSGFVSTIDNSLLSRVSIMCGSQSYKGAGISIHKSRHDRVEKGEKLLTLYSTDKDLIENAREFVSQNDIIHIT